MTHTPQITQHNNDGTDTKMVFIAESELAELRRKAGVMRKESDDVSVSVTVREGEIYLRLYNRPWSAVARLAPSHAIDIGEMLVEIGKERSNQGGG